MPTTPHGIEAGHLLADIGVNAQGGPKFRNLCFVVRGWVEDDNLPEPLHQVPQDLTVGVAYRLDDNEHILHRL